MSPAKRTAGSSFLNSASTEAWPLSYPTVACKEAPEGVRADFEKFTVKVLPAWRVRAVSRTSAAVRDVEIKRIVRATDVRVRLDMGPPYRAGIDNLVGRYHPGRTGSTGGKLKSPGFQPIVQAGQAANGGGRWRSS